MTPPDDDFQRARRPEQVRARRAAILETASAMLRERPVAEISLRELSHRVGLAKSNVLRYFDSREAIFLELLDRNWREWLDELDPELRDLPEPEPTPFAREIAVATAVATSLIAKPLLCELVSATLAVLERNIPVEFARVFKRRVVDNSNRFATLVAREVPGLSDAKVTHYAGAVFVLVAGLWPCANPTEAVATAMAEMGLPPAGRMFVDGLTDGLVHQLIGLSAAPGR
ncbi:TetR family transcriptional regulator [Umezawaea sp. Da 62-37]|uniref:TetR/AcrR family transcriptional regulator n=1 Tax=Umezawaea sp. Da 62-37 TaxID=3075927 RepID=UPI0028F6D2ED|nr:TetR family transcriptional regulator [Umezawaea sp. Da 62-37]WNV82136.1 TetR family transcriptional regulator [Umezawaea sp. Da 62-37]